MELEVSYFILCDEVRTDPNNLLRLDIHGLITHIRATATPPFPLIRPLLSVLIVLTGCRGAGDFSLRIVQDGTGRVIFRNQPRRLRFASAPEEAVGMMFRLKNCTFPAAGVYFVEAIFCGVVIARRRLFLTLPSEVLDQ